MKITTFILDLGGVFVDWNPKYLYQKLLKTETEIDSFLQNVCTFDWNENHDAGYPIAQGTAEKIKQFPEYESLIKAYYERWVEMLGGLNEEMIETYKKIIEKGYRHYALTNWSAETFPIAKQKFEFLHWFQGILVSGEEKIRKPFPEIYTLTLNRFTILPQEAIFIDDNLRNIESANQLGINTIHFENVPKLLKELEEKFQIVL